MPHLSLGQIALDGTKIKANASKHKALSHAQAEKIEAQLKDDVKALMGRAEAADQDPVPDGMDVPAEIARREARLAAIAEAKAKIEARAAERFAAEQQEFAAKQAKRQAQREAGKPPRGKDPEPPSSAGPRGKDPINLTDEASRIMPVSGGGFDQCYNAQAGVDAGTMLVISAHVTQATNDKQQVEPVLEKLAALPEELGKPTELLADAGYFSAVNVSACAQHKIEPLLAMKRESHHLPVFERFASDTAAPETDDPVRRMAHRLTTKAGRALYGLRKQSVEPVFGIIKYVMGFRRFSLRGLEKVSGEWTLVALAWNVKRMNVLRMA